MKSIDNKGFGHVEIIVAALVLVTIGTIGTISYNRMQKNKDVASLSSLEPISADAKDLISVDKIKEIAALKQDSPSVTGLELAQKDGVLVYEIKLSNGKVLVLNAKTGAEVSFKDVTDEDIAEISSDIKVTVGFEKVLQLVSAQYPGKQIAKIELEFEDGILLYKVKFKDGSRILVSSADGSVINAKNKSDSNGDTKGGNTKESSEPSRDSSNESDNNKSVENETETNDSTASDSNSGSNHDTNKDTTSNSNSGSGGSNHDDGQDD